MVVDWKMMTEGFVFENYKKIVLYGASSRGEKVFNYFYDMNTTLQLFEK